jgi:hypothetical protein
VSYANFWLLLGLAAILVGVSLLALRHASRSTMTRPAHPAPPWPGVLYSRLVPAITIASLMIGFAVASSVNDDWANGPYLLDDPTARATAARTVVSRDRCLCFTSARGHVDWSNLGPNSARSALIDFFPDDLRMTVLLLVQGDGQTPAFGRMRVEFGDGEQTPWAGVLAERRVEHVYRQSGTYQVRVWFQLPTRVAPQLHTQAVEVRSRL